MKTNDYPPNDTLKAMSKQYDGGIRLPSGNIGLNSDSNGNSRCLSCNQDEAKAVSSTISRRAGSSTITEWRKRSFEDSLTHIEITWSWIGTVQHQCRNSMTSWFHELAPMTHSNNEQHGILCFLVGSTLSWSSCCLLKCPNPWSG